MIAKNSIFIFFLLITPGVVFAQGEDRFLTVTVPVADIRSKPQDFATGYKHDKLQETQVLFNEVLLYKASEGLWYKVEAIEQKEYTHNNIWQGYPGYIKQDDVRFISDVPEYNIVVSSGAAEILDSSLDTANVLLRVSIGTKFKMTGEDNNFYKIKCEDGFGWINKDNAIKINSGSKKKNIRKDIVKTAEFFLNTPYFWGGRSYFMPQIKDVITGIDCSGLVNLVYRANGINIPRDAEEQWMEAVDIMSFELKPADLIFISDKEDFKRITHVMLFIGGEEFIEAPGTGKKVITNNFAHRFGTTLSALKDKTFIANGKKVYFKRVKGIDE